MSHSTNNLSKATYSKPTLIEYGSLAERTKMFGLPDVHSDLLSTVSALTVTSLLLGK